MHEWDFVNAVDGKALWPIIGRTAAVGAPVERILGHRDLPDGGWIEDLRTIIDKRTPGIVGGHCEVLREPLLQTSLQRMIDRRSGVGAFADNTEVWIHTLGCRGPGDRRIAIQSEK